VRSGEAEDPEDVTDQNAMAWAVIFHRASRHHISGSVKSER
jgi:hypothetical protein